MVFTADKYTPDNCTHNDSLLCSAHARVFKVKQVDEYTYALKTLNMTITQFSIVRKGKMKFVGD
jgi:hypothetical protein